jgi:multisubunit Na+/H+ antiporter MnhC subunit
MTLFDAYGYEDLSLTAVTIQLTMICLALVAGCGAVAKQPGLLLLAFAVSFMPIGLYMLGSPGIFAFIGVANIGYAVAAMIISYGQYSQERLSK